MNLKSVIERNDTKAGRVFDLFIQALIIISLISFSIETIPDLNPETGTFLNRLEALVVLIFTVEYLLRILVADRKLSFVFSFFGVVDLLAILPFYLTTSLDLRSIRVLRFLRLFRTFKLVRYSRAIQRFYRAFLIAKEEIILFFCVAMIFLFFAGVGIYYFENQAQPEVFKSVFHSLWWALCTLTTVGYGDAYPVTLGGKFFTFLVLMIGLGVVSVPAGLVASALSKARELDEGDVEK